MEFDEYMIYVYTPAMLVAEKLRAICQQMPEYKKIVPNPSPSARAKDFFDIYVVAEQFHVNLGTGENQALMKRAFGAKRVPLQLLGRIKDHREFHRAGFPAVEDTLKPGENLRGFDFYFDYVVRLVGCLVLCPC